MIISNMNLRLVPRDDTRYFDLPFGTDLYLLECETDKGPHESSFLMHGEHTQEKFVHMLNLFASAVRQMK